MVVTRTAKLFRNGASQAVRLPSEFRFKGKEVYVTRDDRSGDVVVSKHPGARPWGEFFELVRSLALPKGYMSRRPMNAPLRPRGVFDGET